MSNKLKLTRGDTLRLHIDVFKEDGTVYELSDGDELTFTLKRDPMQAAPLVQKTGSDVTIAPEDTEDLPFGVYWYDVQLTFSGGDVWTVIKPTSFEILPEVTW